MYDAFISYARADLPFVRELKRTMDERRLHVFVDLESLRAGQDWPPQVGAALRNSRMMVLCWSVRAADSKWVEAETHQCLLMNRPVLPWLLDNTPLPHVLSQIHGIEGNDLHLVANQVVNGRRREHRRVAISLAASTALLIPIARIARRFFGQNKPPFRGHVLDEEGKPVSGALVEVGGIRGHTGADGDFRLQLPGPPGAPVRLRVSKAGYVERIIETQSDVPDLGIVITKQGG
jgi:hypothetical protein